MLPIEENMMTCPICEGIPSNLKCEVCQGEGRVPRELLYCGLCGKPFPKGHHVCDCTAVDNEKVF